jgi:hypothetical protein
MEETLVNNTVEITVEQYEQLRMLLESDIVIGNYVLGFLTFFTLVIVLRYVYKFFNIFF